MYVNILEILHQRGKSINWLSHELGCSYSNLWSVCNNQTSSIDFELLEDLCKVLNVGVEEILIIDWKVGE